MTPLRFGILGTGNIAAQFCAGLSSSNRCIAHAVGSRSEEAAQAFADKFSIVRRHGTYDGLLADPEVDAIYLSLPNALHHEWTLRCLRAGKHVLCEKPIAATEREAREMFDEARRANRKLVEAFMYVSHPQTKRYLQLVHEERAIGELKLIRANFCFRTTRIDGNIRFDPKLAGGSLMDVGCYCINFCRLLAREEPSHVFGVGTMSEHGAVDQSAAGVLRFPSGVLATFSCGLSIQADNSAHVCGTDGYLDIPWPWKPQVKGATFTLSHGVPPRQDKNAATTIGPPPKQLFEVDAEKELYALEADEFAAHVLDGAPPAVSEANSIGNTRILEALRKQIGLGF